MMITLRVKKNLLIPQGQQSLLRDEGKVEPEPEIAKVGLTDEDSRSPPAPPKTKEVAREPSIENSNPRTFNIHI